MKTAVVGLGYWGPLLVRNLSAMAECSQVVAFDTDEERCKAIRIPHSDLVVAASFEDILDDDEIRAVVLATPVATHVELALRVIESGKNVLVEKPLATSQADAERLVRAADARGVLVMAGHTFLYSPAVLDVRDRLRRGQLGKPVYVHSSRVNLGIHRSDASVLWDLAPHDLSILLEWLDETPERVSATGLSSLSGRAPDVAFVYVEFSSGAVANLHLSWLAPTKLRRTMLVATKKMVVYEDTDAEEPVKIYDKGVDLPDPSSFGEHNVQYRTGDVLSPRVGSWEPLQRELQDFLRRCAAGERPGKAEEKAVTVVAVIEAAEMSLGRKGAPVEVGRRDY